MTMNANFKASAGDRVRAELGAKAIITRRGIGPGLNHFYMDFASKMLSLSKKHKGAVLENEACIAWHKWSSRGLNDAALDEIMQLYLPGKSCITMACDYPAEADVLAAVVYAYGAKTGTYTCPACDFPAVGDVVKGVLFDNGTKTGTFDQGLPWTGQTNVYLAGDDGTYQKGHTTDRPEPGNRFTDNSDGTVTDNATGLMWVQDSQGAGCNYSTPTNWYDAVAFCEALDFAGHDDWRLPNVHELASLLDFGRWGPAINNIFTFVNDYTWTSTTHQDWTTYAYVVEFGSSFFEKIDKSTANIYLRPVRGGKP